MPHVKNRLKEIQSELDLLMDEVARLQQAIKNEGRRRTYPFPFEPWSKDDRSKDTDSDADVH